MDLNNVLDQIKRPEVICGILLGLFLMWYLMNNQQKFLPTESGIAMTKYGPSKNQQY